ASCCRLLVGASVHTQRGAQPCVRRPHHAPVPPHRPADSPSTSWRIATPAGAPAFGHTQRTGNFAASRRRDRAWQAFWQHGENCADCDPSGIPCRTYGALW
ncbi:hypothetical protein, partial [Streptomyces mirabilis]|uniref:hypothetical protein n=1 Tax=Streptomyces mirabilis TaxID=68239 RepID=UPI00367E3AE7